MGAPNTEQLPEFNQGYVYQRQECPKYNWTKLDPWERVSVNLMDAIGAKNAVIGGAFGLVIFAIAVFFFREKIGNVLLGSLTKKKGG